MKLPKGFLFSAIQSGIKKNKLDLGCIVCGSAASAVGFFTKNKNVSYSVTVSKQHINNPVKAVMVNSGNANCFSHPQGQRDTQGICEAFAAQLGVKKENILIASTGIIGKKLPWHTVKLALPSLVDALGDDFDKFAKCIMTTDTFPKKAQATIRTGGGEIASIVGCAKGAGMIAPNMATLLVFILTDARLPKPLLRTIMKEALDKSFNSITIDGCTSTNDTLLLLSSNQVAIKGNKAIQEFRAQVSRVCLDLAKSIVRDGEGASKFIEIEIAGAKTEAEAKKAGLAIANSDLFKCAVYGANPNWGRIVQALGQADIAVSEKVKIRLSDLTKKDITVYVDLKRGKAQWTAYTCDLTPEYVKINAEYS